MKEQVTPAFTPEAEQSFLGSLLLNNEKWDEVSLMLTEDNFYVHAHKVIFNAMKALFEQSITVDVITLERALTEKGVAEQVGGLAYLAELSQNTPSASNIVAYAQIIKRDSQARELFALGNELRTQALKVNSQDSLDSLIEQTDKKLTALTFNQLNEETTVSVVDALESVINKMTMSAENQSTVTGTSFGIERLDRKTAGAQNTDLIILAARPSMGKTALSLKFAESALNMKEQPVQYFSLEMPAEQLMQRFLAMLSRVSMQKLKQAATLEEYEWGKIADAMGFITNKWQNRLLIDDSSYLTPQMLRTRARRNARKYGMPSMIIVDYIQLMSDPKYQEGKNRNLEIGSISRALKALAKEMNCPVIALSQLNRNLENRADRRPMPSDLRDSGSLEQDADLLMFIYRDEVYNQQSEERGVAEIIIGKQRNGPIGTVYTQFKGEFSTFENLPQEKYEQLKQQRDLA